MRKFRNLDAFCKLDCCYIFHNNEGSAGLGGRSPVLPPGQVTWFGGWIMQRSFETKKPSTPSFAARRLQLPLGER